MARIVGWQSTYNFEPVQKLASFALCAYKGSDMCDLFTQVNGQAHVRRLCQPSDVVGLLLGLCCTCAPPLLLTHWLG